jgi:phosphate transport system substrate-binding protein
VQPALGSSGGIGALIAGRIDLAVSNRKPKDAELAQAPPQSVEYARTPFVVAVHKDLGITTLSSAQLASLYDECAATFPNGKRARPVLRLSDAGDTELLKSFSPEVATAVDAASKRRGMLNADTDSEAAELAEHTAGAFAVSTLALIESEQRPLAALTIDAKVPSVAHLIDGSYPYYKTLYLIASPNAGPNARLFAAFVQSSEGRALLRSHGHLPR